MKMNKKKYLLFYFVGFFLFTGLTSCKRDRLEKFFLRAEENPDYFVMSIPSSTIEIDKSKLDKQSLAQIESVKKINILLYKPDNSNKLSKDEYLKAERIINDEEFKKLFHVTNEGRKLAFVYQGDPQNIKKITFLGKDTTGNFILGYIKAKNLSTEALLKAIKNLKRVDNHHINEFLDEFKHHPGEKK